MDILVLILCGLGFLLGGFILYGSYLNKKKNKGREIAGTYKKPCSAKWFGWSVYAIGVIAMGYWVFNSYSVNLGTAGLSMSFFFIWTVFGGWLMVKVPKQMKLINSTEKSEVVKVISKTTKTSGSHVYMGTEHFVSFKFSDGSRKNFPVDVNQYNSVAENETGTLTYKEHKSGLMFIGFQGQP